MLDEYDCLGFIVADIGAIAMTISVIFLYLRVITESDLRIPGVILDSKDHSFSFY